VLYDVPPTRSTLPADLPADAELAQVDRARQGRTSAGELGYFGPRPPRGDEPHHYHFELFALDTTLSLEPGARSDDVVRAMRGHVLASGDLVGRYRAPQK
jgi:Raf kinase inhibitor-like YbhB/YbcL family protein